MTREVALATLSDCRRFLHWTRTRRGEYDLDTANDGHYRISPLRAGKGWVISRWSAHYQGLLPLETLCRLREAKAYVERCIAETTAFRSKVEAS